jgi:hypothetical protein
MGTQRSIRFSESVDPDSSITLTKEVEEDATVEQLDVRIYRGAELALRVTPFVKRDNRRFELVEFRGKDYIDGDGDFWEFSVSEAVETEDQIGVEVENVDDEYLFDFAVNMTVDREGGTARPLSSLFDTVRGWL